MIADTLPAVSIEWGSILPIVFLLAGACALMLLGTLVPVWNRTATTVVTVAAAVAGIVAAVVKWNFLHSHKGDTIVGDALTLDRFGTFATVVVLVAVVLGALLMASHHDAENGDPLERHALLLTSAIGAVVMATTNDMLVLFLGLEALSLSLYLLAASDRRRVQSQESGLKYFILGGFASAFLLYGIALVYGSTMSLRISGIAQSLDQRVPVQRDDALLLVGIGLLVVGMAFKVSAAPFQSWTPDVYEGAPTPVTAYMASAGKVAAFAAMLRVLLVGLERRVDDWRPVVVVLAILTILVGSTMAVVQTNVKRMLAYSSITHAGFILVGVEAASHPDGAGLAASMAYLAVYTVLVMGSFAVLVTIAGGADSATSLDAFKGLARRRPVLALAFSTLLFAQAGVPFTSGFVAKFGVIKASADAGSYAVAVIAMVGAVIGAFLYLRIVVGMWMEEPSSDEPIRIPAAAGAVLAVSVAFTLVIGFFPGLLLDAADLVRFVAN